MAKSIPILPRHRIAVDVFDNADGERFAELFRRVWQRLSLSVRRALLLHWRQGLSFAFSRACENSPAARIELRRSLPGVYGSHSSAVEVLSFACPTCSAMPDEAAQSVIAHELAHAWIAATGRSEDFRDRQHHDYDKGGEAYHDDPEEIEVRRIQAAWGFPDRNLRAWGLRRLGKPTNDKGD